MIQIDIQKKLHGSQGKMDLIVNQSVNRGEFVVLMGESGAGKTTLLRVLAGLEEAKGSIFVGNTEWQNNHKRVSPQQRNIGFVFQDYALFDNMSVEENLFFVNNDKALLNELLVMTELVALRRRNVQGLSGGQKQRVALCRAIMQKPKLLLMDEPFSALDSKMRKRLRTQLKDFHQRFDMTTVMVSHDASEMYALADRVWRMEQGKIIQEGTAHEVLSSQDEKAHYVEVLKLHNAKATVCIAGELLEVEVNNKISVGEEIKVVLQPCLYSNNK